MKIAFIYNGTEHLGVEYLSSYLKAHGHETSLFFDPAVFSGEVFINNRFLANLFNRDERIVSSVISYKPDVIAFSTFSGNYQWCLKIAELLKNQVDTPIVFGGIHPTAVPKKVIENDFIDYVVIGEGEGATLELVEHIMNGSDDQALMNTPNLCFKLDGSLIINPPRPYIHDLDSLPFADKEMFFSREPLFMHNPYMIMTSRGCPYSCSFCSNSMLHDVYTEENRHIRRRSPENVISELKLAKERWHISSVSFVDDVFTISGGWLEKFLESYRNAINLPFYCNIHPLAFTSEIATMLKQSGCRLIVVGVQSGSERIRRNVYLRRESNEAINRAVDVAKQAGLNVNIDHIFGAPGETEEDIVESLRFCRNLKPQMVQSFWLTYYPGTPIIASANKSGVLSDEQMKGIDEGLSGYTHDVGSVDESLIPLYKRYELLLTLSSVIKSQRAWRFVEANVRHIPMKKIISMGAYTFCGIRFFRPWVINKFRYALSRHRSAS